MDKYVAEMRRIEKQTIEGGNQQQIQQAQDNLRTAIDEQKKAETELKAAAYDADVKFTNFLEERAKGMSGMKKAIQEKVVKDTRKKMRKSGTQKITDALKGMKDDK
jgi:enamine deaminase RidA (YjgF/YER057c/UK114 family)